MFGILAGQVCVNDTIIFMYDNNGDAFGFINNVGWRNQDKGKFVQYSWFFGVYFTTTFRSKC